MRLINLKFSDYSKTGEDISHENLGQCEDSAFKLLLF